MIKSVKINLEGTHFPCKWLPKVKQFKKKAEFTFGPGLNVIIGPNGSGKSTLTRSIARLFYSEQGGRSTLTQHAMLELYDFTKDYPPDEFFTIDHDGGPVFYVNQSDEVGLMGSHFDDDFFEEGLVRTTSRMSSGQTSCSNINRMLALAEEYVKGGNAVDDRLGGRCNHVYQKKVDKAMAFLKPNRDSIFTLIMDEPDASLDLLNEARIWNIIRGISQKWQVIVCTHSVFALQSEANFIEMETGYHKKCLRAISKLKNKSGSK